MGKEGRKEGGKRVRKEREEGEGGKERREGDRGGRRGRKGKGRKRGRKKRMRREGEGEGYTEGSQTTKSS